MLQQKLFCQMFYCVIDEMHSICNYCQWTTKFGQNMVLTTTILVLSAFASTHLA
jgi:hypothetical protein